MEESNLSTGVSENLKLSSLEDEENFGEVSSDIVSCIEEKGKTEAKEQGECSYVFVGESVEETPRLESKEVEDVVSDESDTCKIEDDSPTNQEEGFSGEDIEETKELAAVSVFNDDDENIGFKLEALVEIEPIQPELHMDNLISDQQNQDAGEVDTLVEIGCTGDGEDSKLDLELEGEFEKNQDSEVVVLQNLESAESKDVFSLEESQEGLEVEVATCPLNNTQLEVEIGQCIDRSGDSSEVTDEGIKEKSSAETAECIYKINNSLEVIEEGIKEEEEMTEECIYKSDNSLEVTEEVIEEEEMSSHESVEGNDEDGKEEGDSSYVFVDGVDMVSDDPVEREPAIDDKSESKFVNPNIIVFGSVVCEFPPSCIENSPGSVDNSKSETGIGKCSFDKGEYMPTSPNNQELTEGEFTSDIGSNESLTPAGDVYLESSEAGSGSALSNRESTPSSSTNTLEENVDKKIDKKLIFRNLIKVPRYIDENIGEQIGLAELQVDEMTRRRDAVRMDIQIKKVACSVYRNKFEAAKEEQRAAHDALHVKRKEMEAVQSKLNRIMDAVTIDQISDKIRDIQYRMQHETIPLKEEKQLIREMKQLKLQSQQLSSVLERQTEKLPTFDQKGVLEEQFKLLKQELHTARTKVVHAEGSTDHARKIYFDENGKLRDLQAQFRSANFLRQDAYSHLQKLKKQLYEKNKYFRAYKDDARKAESYKFSGDREALHYHCLNQVENVMELWNKNDDFRKEYIRCNKMSTVRRLGTLDGRSLGPDEDPPKLQNFVDYKVVVTAAASAEKNQLATGSALGQGKSLLPLVAERAEETSVVKQQQKDQTTELKESVPFVLETSIATISRKEKVEEESMGTQEEKEVEWEADVKEECTQTPEEKEREEKEDALRKEAAAAKIREERLLEERTKAKEAEERKKRNVEKAQVRAEIKARKEAEQKEKERAKRERKKARKTATQGIGEKEASELSPENTLPEPEIEEKPKTASTSHLKPETGEKQAGTAKQPGTASKRPRKLGKQTKTKVVPPPLRNKNKKQMQPWMWILLLLGLVLAAIFFLPSLGSLHRALL